MDGTLLDPSGRITPASASALRALAARGLKIILASGRMTARVIPFIRELGLPLDLVSFNGAEVREYRDGEWHPVLSRQISARTRDEVFALCRDRGHFLNVYSEGRLHGYHRSGDYRHGDFYASQTLAVYASRVSDLSRLPASSIQKLLVIESPENRDRLFREWLPLLSGHCQVLKSNPEYLEFVAQGTSKGSALGFWLERNGISPAELVAFGDAENDLEMLQLAGFGIAMANATPGLRSEFTRVSPWSHAEDGVARELTRLFGL